MTLEGKQRKKKYNGKRMNEKRKKNLKNLKFEFTKEKSEISKSKGFNKSR